jgi:hypothetical protein
MLFADEEKLENLITANKLFSITPPSFCVGKTFNFVTNDAFKSVT